MQTLLRILIVMFILYSFTTHKIHSQSLISGSIQTNDNKPLSYANVLLVSAADSSLVKGEFSADDGSFAFVNIAANNYLILISMLGFEAQYSQPIYLENGQQLALNPIILTESATQLDDIMIVAKKPLFEQKIDRLTINVATSITSAGTTALQVLERSPGVMVNRQQGSIAMAGKNGVVVMINGKINRMPISAVVEYLDGMPSSSIDKIELITTPPANFDAEGNAGFINIVLNQANDQGFNGSYALSAGYGRGGTGNANVNGNYRTNKLNIFGDYTYFRNSQRQTFGGNRLVNYNNIITETISNSDRNPLRINHTGRLGIDYQLNQKTVIGALLTSYDTKWTMEADNMATFSKNGIPDALITIENNELNQWRHYGANFNIQHSFQKDGILTFDVDHLYYKDNNPNDYVNSYFDGANNFLFEELTQSDKITPLSISVGKLDYAKSFGKNLKFETGIKGTLSSFTNDVSVTNNKGQGWIKESDLSGKYNLNEKIMAAYSALDWRLDDKTNIKMGLRYEFTDSNLGSEEEANIVDREYGRFFPSIFLSRQFNERNSANLSFVRRITRPTFNDMAPFVIFLDPFTFISGSAALQPAISNAVKLDYKISSVLLSIQYTVEDSTITSFQSSVDPLTNRQTYYPQNLKDQRTASFTLAFPLNPFSWWNMQFNFTGFNTQLRTYFDGDLLSFKQSSLNIFASQTFTLPHSFALEVSGFYNSKALSGSITDFPFGSLNAGLQKKFKNDGGSLRLGYDNILNTMVWKSELDLLSEQGQQFENFLDFIPPTVRLTYSKNFGNSKLKSTRQRETGAEDERRRVN